jgi:hypothetical protein
LQNFPIQRSTAVVLSHADPDGDPLLERREDLVRELELARDGARLTATIPPHAVVFVTAER